MGLGARRELTGSCSGLGMGEQRGAEPGTAPRERERPGRERVGLCRHCQVSARQPPDPCHPSRCLPASSSPPPQGRRHRAAAQGCPRRLPAAPRAWPGQALVPVGAGALRRRPLLRLQDTPGTVLRGGESAARGRGQQGVGAGGTAVFVHVGGGAGWGCSGASACRSPVASVLRCTAHYCTVWSASAHGCPGAFLHGVSVHWCVGASVHRYAGAWVHCCINASKCGCTNTWLHGCVCHR